MYNQAPATTLYLTRLSENYYRGTINQLWSSVVNLIRSGYKFETTLGESGVVESVQMMYIYIRTESPLSKLQYNAGEWELYVPTVTDLSKFNAELFENTQIIPQILQSLQSSVDEVDDSVLRLNYSKDYSKTSNELLSQTLADIGIEFYEAVSVETLRRLVQESVSYNKNTGRKRALDYIGISLGVDLKYEQLWTNNYQVFYPKNEVPYNLRDSVYPTNYVRITYDNLGTDINEKVIKDMFYQLAWICNVIYDIIYANELPTYTNYYNTGILIQEFVSCKNGDTEMEQAIEETYSNHVYMPVLNLNL